MKRIIIVLLAIVFFGGCATAPIIRMSEAAALEEIMALELATYETWYGKSDPTAYAQLFADKATYFDPWSENMIEDRAIKEYLMAFAGQIPSVDYKILNPRIDLYGNTAVFVFNLEVSDPKDGMVMTLWKGTTVFTRTKYGWEKVHANWSFTLPLPE
jgi:hypothetical protein